MRKIYLFGIIALTATPAFAAPAVHWDVSYVKTGSPTIVINTESAIPIPSIGTDIDVSVDTRRIVGKVTSVKQVITRSLSGSFDQYSFAVEIDVQ